MKIFSRLKVWSDSRGISKQEVADNEWKDVEYMLSVTYKALKSLGVKGYVLNILEELIEYAEAKRDGDVNGAIDAIGDSTVYNQTELLKEGYDIEKTMDEVLKVVEARTGSWEDSIGKFVKDKSPQAKAKWYIPDYVNRCKLPIVRTNPLVGFGWSGDVSEEHC